MCIPVYLPSGFWMEEKGHMHVYIDIQIQSHELSIEEYVYIYTHIPYPLVGRNKMYLTYMFICVRDHMLVMW